MALQGSAPTDAYQFANYLKTVEPKSRSNSEPADNAKSFIICHRDDSAERDFRYSHDNPVAVCVTNCINLCRSMLENHEVRNAFTTIAEDYSQKSAIACPEHEGDMSRVTDDFIQKIRNEFPIVFVNNSWKNPRMMTAQFRQPSCGSFRSCNHYILMNGTTLNYMVQAAKKAKRATNDTERKSYQAFLFREGNSLLHQMGHTFVTYLSRGGANGPPITTATEAWDPSPNARVVGYTLEALIFGGTIEYWVDPDHGTSFDECGAPYLIDTISRWRILPEIVERTVNCDFKFPYEHKEDADTRQMTPLGCDIPMDEPTNPMSHPMWSEYRNTWPRRAYSELILHRAPHRDLHTQAAGEWEKVD